MNKQQAKGMLKFHRKAERAYRKAGRLDMAQQARNKRIELINFIKWMK